MHLDLDSQVTVFFVSLILEIHIPSSSSFYSLFCHRADCVKSARLSRRPTCWPRPPRSATLLTARLASPTHQPTNPRCRVRHPPGLGHYVRPIVVLSHPIEGDLALFSTAGAGSWTASTWRKVLIVTRELDPQFSSSRR